MLFFVACQKGDEPVPFSSQNGEEGVYSSQRIGDVPTGTDTTGFEGGTDDGKVIGGDDNEDDDDLDNGMGPIGGGTGGIVVGEPKLGGGV